MRSRRFALLAILLCTSAAARALAAASLTPLGGLSCCGVYSVAHGVSADGSVVVGGTTNSLSYGEAFRWTSAGGMVGLGGFVSSEAFGVSGDGSVVVGRSGFPRSVFGGVRGEAFRWTPGGGMEALGTLPGGVESTANDVSDDGSVVVGWNNASATTIDSEAFRWTSAGGMVGLGYLPGGVSSYADAVSADGSVVVGLGSSSATGGEAFRWTSAGGMVGLGTLPGGIGSAAGGVSADGSVVVGVSTSASGAEAFRWTSDGGMVGLGDQPGGSGSYASGVSGDGSIVVGFSDRPSFLDEGFRAFYWTADGGMRALWDVLLSHGVDPAADGWSELSHAVDISADGNTIVGYGIRNDNHEAFVAVIPTSVPEPGTGALALLGVGSILLLRRRSQRRPNKLPWAPGTFRARRQIIGTNVCALLATLLCTSAAARAFAASLTPLGILPGGSGSIANGVSDDGSVVVGHSLYNFGLDGQEAFRWTSADGMVGLGYLPGGGTASVASGVSADGSVIVGSSDGQAYRWTNGSGMVGLGFLPGGSSSGAKGVSADGSVIVGTSGDEAFRWTSGGGMVGLGSLWDGYGSAANGVSDDGSVVVGSSLSVSNGGLEAFRWTADGGMVGLGGLPGGMFSFESYAAGVSGDGAVVVGWNYLSGLNFPDDYYLYDLEFFRWTSDGGMVGLGTLPGGEYGGEATGVSDDGSVIVGYNFTTWDTAAFLWTSGGGMQRLWDVLLAQGLDPAADGWTELVAAYDISADGNTIVGSGQRNGNIEAFVAVIPIVPEPPGDFNHDGTVDAADYVLWRKNNIDGESGYNTWRANFGATAVAAAAVAHSPTSVPEPATAALVLLGVSSTLLLRRRSLGRPRKFVCTPATYRARKQIMRSNVCAFLAILLCTSAAARAFAAASLTPLGFLPGGASSLADGVSGDGSVVVGLGDSDSGIELFRWTSVGGMVGSGHLPGGGSSFKVYGVSGDGSVIVGSGDSGSGIEAFRWTSDGGIMGLGKLPGGSSVSFSEANDVSGDGAVIVGYSSKSGSQREAFRWTSEGGMVGLDDLPGGGFYSQANGVSADGSVIVGTGNSASGDEAFRWTSGGGMVGLGKLPSGSSFPYSRGNGVSADGSVVVGYSGGGSVYEAFRWTSGGGMVGLGKLPGALLSEAYSVSGDGSVVIGLSNYQPFYWTAEGGMQSLWDVLLSHGVDPAADGWSSLDVANAISADGSTIIGFGVRNGNVYGEAFVAVIPIVPEPAAGALALLGVSSILLLRQRSLWRPNKLTVLPFQALAGALTLIAAAPAVAIDTEPLNNSQLTADSLPTLLPGTAVSNFARLDGAGGDVDFFQTPLVAGEVLFGMITPLAGLPTSFTPPDTVVSVFDDTGARTFNEDDDAGELADIEMGYGSVFRFLSPAAADYRIGVSGSSDYEVDGAASGESHTQTGGYVLTAGRVNPAVPGGGFTDTDPANQTAAGADLIPVTPGTARVAVAHLGDADVDFFRLDLNAGDVLSAMTAPLNDLEFSFNSPDTLIGLFDSGGTNLLVANDDSGGYSSIFSIDPETGEIVLISPDLSSDFPGDQFGGLASALRALIPADGTYYLAVTGAFDDGFSGAHFETGAYALLVGVAVPEPGSALLAAVTIAACGLRRVLKPHRLRHALHA